MSNLCKTMKYNFTSFQPPPPNLQQKHYLVILFNSGFYQNGVVQSWNLHGYQQ